MAWLCVEKNGDEYVFEEEPFRATHNEWFGVIVPDSVELPKGTIKKILGYELTWNDEPVEIKE